MPASRQRAAFAPSGKRRELSEFEFALITLMFGFSRWIESCMEAAGFGGLSALDILVLHVVNHRARGRRLAEVCMVLNIDNTHLVSYALKKLIAAELVRVLPAGRERHYETTLRGDEACIEYRKVREGFLVPSLSWLTGERNTMRETGAFLRPMMGSTTRRAALQLRSRTRGRAHHVCTPSVSMVRCGSHTAPAARVEQRR